MVNQSSELFEKPITDQGHFIPLDVEVTARIPVGALYVVIIQHSPAEVERTFQALAWAVSVAHLIHLELICCDLVAHLVLLVAVHVCIIAPNKDLVNQMGIGHAYWIRTSGPRLRRALLYPTELRRDMVGRL